MGSESSNRNVSAPAGIPDLGVASAVSRFQGTGGAMIDIDDITLMIQFGIGMLLFYRFVRTVYEHDMRELQRKADEFVRRVAA